MAKVVRFPQEISKLRFRLTCPIRSRHAARLEENLVPILTTECKKIIKTENGEEQCKKPVTYVPSVIHAFAQLEKTSKEQTPDQDRYYLPCTLGHICEYRVMSDPPGLV